MPTIGWNGRSSAADGHELVEHRVVDSVNSDESFAMRRKPNVIRAIQALRYATRRKEGLVNWSFDITWVSRKDLSDLGQNASSTYFTRLR